MPVLDAKALEMDSKGMAFLKSVLRPVPASRELSKEAPRIGRVRLHWAGRSKELLPGMA
jgi:hypothetical protein